MSGGRKRVPGVRSGAAALVESIARAGAEVVFGYPGGNVVDVFDCLASAPFEFVLGRHEQGVVHMADGYARATGRPGVAIVTSGPGATNAITGLGAANLDGIPLVLVSGQVPLSQIGTDAFQEADMTGICRAVTKHSFLVKSADEIPETVAEAFYIATHGKPGAVVIDLPRNVQQEMTAAPYPERISLRAYHPEHSASTGEVNTLAKWLNEAKRPVIYAGGGVIAANAAADLAALARKASVPVATTLMGIGSFDETDPLSLGMAGMHGSMAANLAIDHADLVVALGVRFNDRIAGNVARYARRARTVHVDCDPSSIDKNVQVDLGIVADVKDLLTTVNSRVRSASHGAWLSSIARWKADEPRGQKRRKRGLVMPQEALEAVSAAAGEDAVFVTDVGQHQMWAARCIRHRLPRRFLSSGGMGAMGFGIPAAIGAAIALRGTRRVVAILGDGGAQMTFQELVVAVERSLPVTFVILNNGGLGMVRQVQDMFFGGRRFGVSLGVGGKYLPDFVALAKAYGALGARVSDPGKLAATMRKAMSSTRPFVVEVAVDPEANVYPMIPAGGGVAQAILK